MDQQDRIDSSKQRDSMIRDLKRIKDKDLVIPLINKRMNKMELYKNIFKSKPTYNSKKLYHQVPFNEQQTQKIKRQVQPFRSQQVSARNNQNPSQQQDYCVQYKTLSNQKSEQRIQALSKLQKQYSILKHKIQTSRSKQGKHDQMKQQQHLTNIITPQQIHKQIKSSIINQNGKNYFADLYLLKKGRQKLISQLSTGRVSGDKTYQQTVNKRQQQFVQHKIIQERGKRKTKMLQGRNLHWNVYYDMLALSASQRQKLKGVCKFVQTYDIF